MIFATVKLAFSRNAVIIVEVKIQRAKETKTYFGLGSEKKISIKVNPIQFWKLDQVTLNGNFYSFALNTI